MRRVGRRATRHGNRLRVSFRVTGLKGPDNKSIHARTMYFPLGTPQRVMDRAVDERIKTLTQRYRAAGGQRMGFAADVERYLQLPQVRKLATFEERTNQVRTLADHFANRDRLTVNKQELETLLGRWQRERDWEPGTFNKWLTAAKSFYNELDDPDGRNPNPARKIDYQQEPDPMPRAIDYAVIARVLLRLGPSATGRNRISFNAEREARRLTALGHSNTAIASELGVSEAAIRKMLARNPQTQARETERARLALRLMAFTGLRQGQVMMLRADQFDCEKARVWVTQSGKGDRSFWKPLDPMGVQALQAFADAQAWGRFDNANARRMWRAACKAEGLMEPLPRPYDLRHSYLTEALIACGSLEALQTLSGHSGTRTLRRYTKAAEDAIARNAADALGLRWATLLDTESEKKTATQSTMAAAAAGPSGLSSDGVVSLKQPAPKPALRLVVNHSR
jgi:integrase